MAQVSLNYDTGTYGSDSGSHRVTQVPYTFYQYYAFTPKKTITDFFCGAYFFVGAGRTIKISTIVLDSTRKFLYESPAVETKLSTNTIPYFESYVGKAKYTLNPGTTYYVGFKLLVVSHDGTIDGNGNYVTPYFLNSNQVTKWVSESEWGTFTGDFGYTTVANGNGIAIGSTFNNNISVYTPYKVLFSTANNAPTAPTSCSATGVFKPKETVTITSGESTDVDGDLITYQFYYSTNGSSWTGIANVNTPKTYFNIPSSVTSSTIEFRVRAFDGYTYSAFTNSSKYTMSYNNTPTVPSSLTATGRIRPGDTITLSSGESTDADGNAVYYHFQYTTDGGDSWSSITTNTSNTVSFVIPSGVTSEYMQFRVRAYDQIDYSDWRTSPEYTVQYNTAPVAPTEFYIEGNPTTLTMGDTYRLFFGGATDVDGDILEYELAYAIGNTASWNLIGKTTNTYYDVTVPLNIPNFRLRLRTYDGTTYSSTSKTLGFRVNNRSTITVTSPTDSIEVNEGDVINLSGKAIDTDSNQAVMVYYQVGDSLEQLITTGVSGASGVEFSKDLTFRSNSLWDGEEEIISEVVPNGGVGEITFAIYVRDSIGATSEIVTRTLIMKPNRKPVLEIFQSIVDTTEGALIPIEYIPTDPDVNESLVIKMQIRGQSLVYEDFLDSPYGEGVRQVMLSQYDSTIKVGETVISEKLPSGLHYLDITLEDSHGEISDVKTINLNVTANRKPLIELNEARKVIVVTEGTYQFSGNISDPDTYDLDKLTLSIRDCGGEVVDIPFNDDGTFTYDYTFDDSSVGVKTLVFIANDQKEINSVIHEFEIVDERILFEFKNPIETDEEARKASLVLGYEMSDNAVLKVLICNNGFDETPTWEDCTQSILNFTPYLFTNTEKTAEKWGINMRIEIIKNDSPEIYVDRVGILFE